MPPSYIWIFWIVLGMTAIFFAYVIQCSTITEGLTNQGNSNDLTDNTETPKSTQQIKNLEESLSEIQEFITLVQNTPNLPDEINDAVLDGQKMQIILNSQKAGNILPSDSQFQTRNQLFQTMKKYQNLQKKIADFKTSNMKSSPRLPTYLSALTNMQRLPTGDGKGTAIMASTDTSNSKTSNELYETTHNDILTEEIQAIDESPQPQGSPYDAVFFSKIWGMP